MQIIFVIVACNNESNKIKLKEVELKEKELVLKEKELAIKGQESKVNIEIEKNKQLPFHGYKTCF